MLSKVVNKTRKALRPVKTCIAPVAGKLRTRHDVAFSVLHPQVEVVKRSPTAQAVMGAGVAGLIVTGHFGPAVGLAGAWIGSKPLTHLVAASVACVGEVDAAVMRAAARLQKAAVKAQAGEKPRTTRRRRTRAKAKVGIPATTAHVAR